MHILNIPLGRTPSISNVYLIHSIIYNQYITCIFKIFHQAQQIYVLPISGNWEAVRNDADEDDTDGEPTTAMPHSHCLAAWLGCLVGWLAGWPADTLSLSLWLTGCRHWRLLPPQAQMASSATSPPSATPGHPIRDPRPLPKVWSRPCRHMHQAYKF